MEKKFIMPRMGLSINRLNTLLSAMNPRHDEDEDECDRVNRILEEIWLSAQTSKADESVEPIEFEQKESGKHRPHLTSKGY